MTPFEQPDAGDPALRQRAFRYAVALVAAQVLALGFCFWASMQPWFVYHDAMPGLRIHGFAERAAGMACEVVIAGDSTALADFLPLEIQARTGLKTCNIAEVRSVADFVGTHSAIDHYLARNPPPRFLITGWDPSDFSLERAHPGNLASPEDTYYALRFDRGPWIPKYMARNPDKTLRYLFWVENGLISDAALRFIGREKKVFAVDEQARRDNNGGAWALAKPPETACEGQRLNFPVFSHEENARGVIEFRKHYQTPRTRVLIDVTPVANCDPRLPQYLRLTEGLPDNTLQAWPVGDFNDQDIHLSPEGAKKFSREVSDQILALMKSAPAATGSDTP